jgi:YVTN family beta-propeller protein
MWMHALIASCRRAVPAAALMTMALFALACGDDHEHPAPADALDEAGAVPQTLFATEGTALVAFDLATGSGRPGAIANVSGPTDMQATESGHLIVNLTDRNEILIVDARTFREVARVPSSGLAGTRPVHGYITPAIGGRRFWAANNDGAPGMPATNSLRFVDLEPASATFLQPVGEIPLGLGHHKNAWSPAKARVSVSNIADCANVVQVVDYAEATTPRLVKKWSAVDLDPARDCAAQGAAPHGGAASANGRGYHNLTGWGAMLSIHQDLEDPTAKLIPTRGSGAGYTKAGKDGRHVYSLQRTPREGDAARPGQDCQIGQLAVIDSETDALAGEVPILLSAGCSAKLPAHAALAGPDHIKITKDGKTMFVSSQAAPPTGSAEPAYSDQLLVFDLTDPARPAQKASIQVGRHSGHRAMALSGDDRHLLVVNANDKTVSQIDVASLAVTRTISLRDTPRQIATWGSVEGPSAQTGPP